MTKTGVLIFFLLINTTAFTQNVDLIKQLHMQLKNADGEKTFNILNELGWEFRFANPDSTIWYANRAYELGSSLALKKDLARPLNYIGIANNYKGERVVAYRFYNQALTLAGEQHDSIQIAHSNNNLGRLFFEQGILEKSYKYYLVALEIFEKSGDLSGIAYTNQSLASLYQAQQDYQKAEAGFLKALEIRKKLANHRDVMAAAAYVGSLYQTMDKLSDATRYFLMADSLGKLDADEINIADVKMRLAENYLRQNNLMEAEKVCAEGFKVIQQLKNKRLLPGASIVMGNVSMAKNEYASAKKYFDASLKLYSDQNDLIGRMTAYRKLAELARRTGQSQLETSLMNQYLLLNDSLEDIELVRQIERLQFQLTIEKVETENKSLKAAHLDNEAKLAKQKFQNIILIIAGLSFLIISGILFWFNKKSKEINLQLIQQNEKILQQQIAISETNSKLVTKNQQLSELNNEKDSFMGIVAHDLKAPLQRIQGLLNLVKMEGQLTPAQDEYLKMVISVTKSSSDLITDLLDVSYLNQPDRQPPFTKVNLKQLIEGRIESFKVAAAMKEIKIQFEPGNLNGEDVISVANYLSRIVDNLLSNAIKFAIPTTGIYLSAGLEQNFFFIKVKDEGPGFTEEDKKFVFQKFKKLSARPTAGESSNGLGLAIVKTLVEYLQGEIILHSEPGKGSEFVVRIPIK